MTEQASLPRKRGRPRKEDVAAREAAKRQAEQHAAKRTPAVIVSEITERFDVLAEEAQSACTGETRGLIVSGAAGIGKTYNLQRILEHASRKQGIRFRFVRGMLTPINLYTLLYDMRAANCVTVLDDCDAIFREEDGLNMLKSALDSMATRTLSWYSNSSDLRVKKADGSSVEVPQEFLYEGTMIFITNLNFEAYLTTKTALTPHIAALISRAQYLDMKLHSRNDIAVWVNHVVRTHNMLTEKGCTVEEQEAALKYMEDRRTRLREVSLRTALKLATIVKRGGAWERKADILLLSNS